MLSASDFSPVTDPAVLLRLRREARGKVYELDLKKYGLGSFDRLNLFINNEKQQEARYPNDGFMTVSNSDKDNIITISDSRASEWENANNAYVTGSLGASYFWCDAKVESVKGGEMTLERTTTDKIQLFVRNLIEEIDLVGEYAVNKETGMLLCYLPENFKDMTIEVVNPMLGSAYVDMNSAEYISFEGITFDKLSNKAFFISSCKNIDIKNCDFNYIQASYAIDISQSKNVTVSKNTAYGCRGGFLTMGNCGNSSTLESGNIVVSDNCITNCGEKLEYINYIIGGGSNNTGAYAPVGNKIINNIIGNCSSVYAVSLPGNDNEIKYNEIYNTGRQINDGGAVYFGASVIRRGNEVAYNYIHNLNRDNMYAGVYVDDGYSGINVHHNVFYDMYHPVHLGLGMDVKVDNNIAVDTGKGILSGTRMDRYPNTDNALYNEMNDLFSNETKKNIYLGKYSELSRALDRRPFFAPYNSEITGNVLYGSQNSFWQTAGHKYYGSDGAVRISGEENNSRITDEMKDNNWVNELATYGAIVTDADGNSLNGTILGNPNTKDCNKTYFRDYDNQDFTLTSEAKALPSYSASGSSAGDIDMNDIGVTDTSILKNETDFNIYPTYSNGELFVKWDRVEGAGKYKIKIGSSESVVYDDNLTSALKVGTVTRGESYYITVTAVGLSRQNPFNISKTVSYTVPSELDRRTLDNALGCLKDEIDSERKYTDDSLYDNMTALYDEINAKTYMEEEEIINDENAIYSLLNDVAGLRDTVINITKCEAVSAGTDVQVVAEGFTPYSLVTVLVTNPGYVLGNLTYENEQIVRYTNMVSADSNGVVKFSFDTSINKIDYEGEYRVYLSGSDGTRLDDTYIYGTVEARAAVFTINGAVVNAEDLYKYVGQTVTVSIPVTNRLNVNITPSFVCGIYSASGNLSGVNMTKNITLNKNSETTAEMKVVIPGDYTALSNMKLMIFDEAMFLKPLSSDRVITKK